MFCSDGTRDFLPLMMMRWKQKKIHYNSRGTVVVAERSSLKKVNYIHEKFSRFKMNLKEFIRWVDCSLCRHHSNVEISFNQTEYNTITARYLQIVKQVGSGSAVANFSLTSQRLNSDLRKLLSCSRLLFWLANEEDGKCSQNSSAYGSIKLKRSWITFSSNTPTSHRNCLTSKATA